MFKNLSVPKAGIILGLLPLTIAGMIWSMSRHPSRLQTNAIAGTTSTPQMVQFSQGVSRDEPLNSTINERFSLDNALTRIQQIREALNSFRKLTNQSRQTLGVSTIQAVGNTDPEIQNLGFYNWTGAVEGTVRKQEYQIKKLEYELAQKQYQDGEISQAELNRKSSEYESAKQSFQAFLKSFNIAD
jgi:hypothetical protein